MKSWEMFGLPVPEAEYRFHPVRRWRFDYAWPDCLVALEVEGGAFTGGRHTRGAGYVKDLEKYSEAAALGWRVVRCTPKQLQTGAICDVLLRAMNWRAA